MDVLHGRHVLAVHGLQSLVLVQVLIDGAEETRGFAEREVHVPIALGFDESREAKRERSLGNLSCFFELVQIVRNATVTTFGRVMPILPVRANLLLHLAGTIRARQKLAATINADWPPPMGGHHPN